MAQNNSREKMVQISYRNSDGGIWVPSSIARKNGLDISESPTEPILSVSLAGSFLEKRRSFTPTLEIEGQVVIPGRVMGVIYGIRRALTPPSPAEAARQLRKLAASSGFML